MKAKTPRDRKYLAWIKTLPCIEAGCGKSPCDPHHTETGGTGLKGSDYSAVPLCHKHHEEWHKTRGKKGGLSKEKLAEITGRLKAAYDSNITEGKSKDDKKKAKPRANMEGGKTRKLTIKQKKLVQGVIEGKSQKKAAIDAGYSEKTAESQASQNLKLPKVKAALTELMDEMGLSDSELMAKHRELLNAQKTVSTLSGKDADSQTVDFVEVPDYQIQKGALEMAYKLKGAFVEKKEVTFPEGLALEVVFGE